MVLRVDNEGGKKHTGALIVQMEQCFDTAVPASESKHHRNKTTYTIYLKVTKIQRSTSASIKCNHEEETKIHHLGQKPPEYKSNMPLWTAVSSLCHRARVWLLLQ